jgi:hypothetical protein
MDTNSLGLQAQSDLAVVFSPQGWLKGLYWNFEESIEIISSSSSNLWNKSVLSYVLNSTKWLSITKFQIRIENECINMIIK